ncbi:hypothetical protein L6452_36208 [Arctium lappa]|uniref:Uncharacterized protein n=1 Tax=Arctium lappa TaxID=4217 RepID=A0ACB8YCS9_ARCLA|nr:hypothetical protein L6452_36208 [Arctium lappa]
MTGLNDAQKNTVREMGLGVFPEMTMNGIPSKIGLYIIDNLDSKKMHLKVDQRLIPISVESIHSLLGMPMGGINLLEVDEEERIEDKLTVPYVVKEEVDVDLAIATSKFTEELAFKSLKEDLDEFLKRGRWEGHGNIEFKDNKKEERSSVVGTKSM